MPNWCSIKIIIKFVYHEDNSILNFCEFIEDKVALKFNNDLWFSYNPIINHRYNLMIKYFDCVKDGNTVIINGQVPWFISESAVQFMTDNIFTNYNIKIATIKFAEMNTKLLGNYMIEPKTKSIKTIIYSSFILDRLLMNNDRGLIKYIVSFIGVDYDIDLNFFEVPQPDDETEIGVDFLNFEYYEKLFEDALLDKDYFQLWYSSG